MNDLHKLTIGALGTVAGWTMQNVESAAAIGASVVTGAYMAVCIFEKIRKLTKHEKTDPDSSARR
jgi:hypothetical protein